ncbi:MAG: FkbM family methyltransferase [Chloroflexi bacterium]|nr:MAG: FkbM family methyltransferase [Chloroflexota bacterium]
MFWLRLTKLLKILSSRSLLSAFLKGAAAGVEHGPVLQSLQCGCVVDIGANRGQFALISRRIFPQAEIHAFEPLEEPARTFKTIFGNDPNVHFHPYAIGREEKTSTIHVTKDDDSSSLLPVTPAQSSMFPGAAEKETRQVTVLPLSRALGEACLPPDSLLKIDVQGFELEVLKGCEDILDRFSHLYIECSFIELYEGQALAHQVIAWLEKRNFTLTGVYNLYYTKNGAAVQGDFLFSQCN